MIFFISRIQADRNINGWQNTQKTFLAQLASMCHTVRPGRRLNLGYPSQRVPYKQDAGRLYLSHNKIKPRHLYTISYWAPATLNKSVLSSHRAEIKNKKYVITTVIV